MVGIVITGGGRAFSAGLDMSVLAATTASDTPPEAAAEDELPGIFSYLLEVEKPVVAALNGVAAGGGFSQSCVTCALPARTLRSPLCFSSVDSSLNTARAGCSRAWSV